MKACNKLGRIVGRINILPQGLRAFLLSLVFGRIIKFAGTAKVHISRLVFDQSVLVLKNRRRVQNHIGSVHAAATGLLGESATGFLLGMHVPDDKIPLLKSMHVDYIKRSEGDLTAVASLSAEQIQHIRTADKGDVSVKVVITDEKGNEPVNAEFIWAWIPKKRQN